MTAAADYDDDDAADDWIRKSATDLNKHGGVENNRPYRESIILSFSYIFKQNFVLKCAFYSVTIM